MKCLLTLLFIFPILSGWAQNPPPPPKDSGTVQQDTTNDKILTQAEIEAEYPGGWVAWDNYLGKNLRHTIGAPEGTVVVQFIVDRQGRLSGFQAISGPKELYREAIRVIKASKLWTPAMQNLHPVKSYIKIPIKFKIEEVDQ